MEENINGGYGAHREEIIGIIEEYLAKAGITPAGYDEMVKEKKLEERIIEQSTF